MTLLHNRYKSLQASSGVLANIANMLEGRAVNFERCRRRSCSSFVLHFICTPPGVYKSLIPHTMHHYRLLTQCWPLLGTLCLLFGSCAAQGADDCPATGRSLIQSKVTARWTRDCRIWAHLSSATMCKDSFVRYGNFSSLNPKHECRNTNESLD